jgi:hypothetical protein
MPEPDKINGTGDRALLTVHPLPAGNMGGRGRTEGCDVRSIASSRKNAYKLDQHRRQSVERDHSANRCVADSLKKALSITGSSDPAIVGKVIRSELGQKVARNSDGQFSLAKQAQAIAIPFSPRLGRSLAR